MTLDYNILTFRNLRRTFYDYYGRNARSSGPDISTVRLVGPSRGLHEFEQRVRRYAAGN